MPQKKIQSVKKFNKDAHLKCLLETQVSKQRLYMLPVKQETHRPRQNEHSNRKRTQQKKPPGKSKVLRGKCTMSANKDLANCLSSHCHAEQRNPPEIWLWCGKLWPKGN